MGSISKNSLIILRRLLTATREYSKAEQAAPTVNKAKMMMVEETTASARINDGDINKVFWMKDPKTGNWMPENHFGDHDVVDLRKKTRTRFTTIED